MWGSRAPHTVETGEQGKQKPVLADFSFIPSRHPAYGVGHPPSARVLASSKTLTGVSFTNLLGISRSKQMNHEGWPWGLGLRVLCIPSETSL